MLNQWRFGEQFTLCVKRVVVFKLTDVYRKVEGEVENSAFLCSFYKLLVAIIRFWERSTLAFYGRQQKGRAKGWGKGRLTG